MTMCSWENGTRRFERGAVLWSLRDKQQGNINPVTMSNIS